MPEARDQNVWPVVILLIAIFNNAIVS